MKKYQLVLRCKDWRCKNKYKRTVEIGDDEDIADYPDPPCPKCLKRAKREDAAQQATAPIPIEPFEESLAQGKTGPALNGQKIVVKAIDTAAKIAMEDYHLTDLKDNLRQGDSMAPKLPPQMQKMADNFFTPATNPVFSNRQKKRLQMIGQNAIKGRYANMAVDVKSVLPDSRVALRKVEILNRK